MNISPARKSAYKCLIKIEKEKAFSSIVLSNNEEHLDKKDKSLCHQIVLGTLRKQLYIDEILKLFIKKNLNKLDLEVLIALRIGVYQLKFLDKIPEYSAINESVNIVKFAKKKSASGMVNAVLRKVSKANIQIEFSDDIENLSIETSHPRWLIEKWIRNFGVEETKKLAESNNEKATNSFRITKKFNDAAAYKQKEIMEFLVENSTKSKFIENSFTANKFNSDFEKLAKKGFIYFQDEGSQIVAESVELQANEAFLDLCASPGSKASYIGKDIDVKSEEAIFVAGDIHQHRINNLRENCNNQGIDFIDFMNYDALRALPFAEESFDVVLIDAPCSGTGTIRSNPEIRYNLNIVDISVLSDKQLVIIQNASKTVKKGGRMIYSTCSLEIEENERVIDRFLSLNSDFSLLKPKHKLAMDEKYFKTINHRDNLDGFFIAFLERNG